MSFKHRLERLYKYEYWSFWLLYLPFLLQWLYYSIRSLNFIYFTRANHQTPFGAFFQYSKYKITRSISTKYLPKTLYYSLPKEVESNLENELYQNKFIYKPDFGERGIGVEIFHNAKKWKSDYETYTYPCLIQEYIEYPIELGILFYRFPSGKKGITSIVGKQFLSVTGNGKETLEQLTSKKVRASKRLNFFKQKFSTIWNQIIENNKEIVLEEIGNHNRGTTFLNFNHIINNDLVNITNDITKDIPGFHYGRIDLKCNSIDELYKGEKIKILEVNGVASEAAHIYDPKMNIIKAYRDIFINNKIIFKISQELKKQGVKTPNTLLEFISAWFVQRKRT